MKASSSVALFVAACGLLGAPSSPADSPVEPSAPPAAKATAAPAPAAPAVVTAANAPAASAQPRDPLAATVIDDSQLSNARGGAESVNTNLTLNQNTSNGNVNGNVATNLTTGSNNLSDSAFSNSAGVPIVIQNTGNNVLIQNSTILNLQLAAPK
jgi:ABC-type uncharacterized transport system involved in gliding motility auxiliary subunit